MFKAERLSPIKKAKYRKKYEEYESILHSIIEITNDKVVMNKNIDYLQGFYDALDLSHARLKAIEKMTGISDACTKEFIKSALHLINGHCTMTQLWIDRALYEMEFPDQVDDSIRFKDLSIEKLCDKYCGNQGSAECVCCPYGRRVHE